MKYISICSIIAVLIMVNTVLFGQKKTAGSEKGDTPHNKTVKIKTSHDIKKITFDFPNTQLNVFAKFVAGLCGKILIGEKFLKGNISIESQTKLSLKEVKELFEAVLYSKGLSFIENDIYMEIIQRSDSIVKVYKINYLKAADIEKSLLQMYKMSFKVGNQAVNVQITSIDEANALMVMAPKNQQLEIEDSIKKMDVRLEQVMLNILILEVKKTFDFGFGANVMWQDNKFTAGFNSGGGTKTKPMTFTTSSIPAAGGVSWANGQWKIDIEGVDNKTRVKILSQPKVLTANNQKAEIKLGKKQPYVTTSVQIGGSTDKGGGNNASTTSSIKTDEVGLNLEITPRINKVNDVTLEFKLEITSITGTQKVQSGTIYDPTKKTSVPHYNYMPNIGHRDITNTSNVKSGEVLVIGGLLKNQKVVTRTAPPILGDIPWIGWVFAKDSESTEQIELMMFISPTIIYNSEESAAITKNETNKLRNYDLETKGTIDQMLTGKKGLNDNIFNIFDYFSNGKYRSEQDFIPQPENL